MELYFGTWNFLKLILKHILAMFFFYPCETPVKIKFTDVLITVNANGEFTVWSSWPRKIIDNHPGKTSWQIKISK